MREEGVLERGIAISALRRHGGEQATGLRRQGLRLIQAIRLKLFFFIGSRFTVYTALC